MKAFLLFCFSAIAATSAMGATYEVPVAPELRNYATFELENFEKVEKDGKIMIGYDLPLMLTGTVEHVKLEGTYVEGSESLFLVGDKGTATCSSLYAICKVEYYNLEINPEKATTFIRSISKSHLEFASRIEVMKSFSTDPVGFINY
jgi:hypothetical protein